MFLCNRFSLKCSFNSIPQPTKYQNKELHFVKQLQEIKAQGRQAKKNENKWSRKLNWNKTGYTQKNCQK